MNKTRTLAAILVAVTAMASAAQGPIELESAEIWDGERIEFAKADGSDPADPANQDRITETVWITRANGGGQIYNAALRSGPSKGASPMGTAWAVGTLDQLADLTFRPFRTAVGSPKDVVGQELVMHIVEENIFVAVRFTSWSSGQRGGFSYERSTPGE